MAPDFGATEKLHFTLVPLLIASWLSDEPFTDEAWLDKDRERESLVVESHVSLVDLNRHIEDFKLARPLVWQQGVEKDGRVNVVQWLDINGKREDNRPMVTAKLLVNRCILVVLYRALGVVAEQDTVSIGGALVLLVNVR